MNFVHVEDFFHPEAGYQVNLLSKLQVQQGHQITVVTSELDKLPKFVTSFFGVEKIREKDNRFFELTGVKIIRIPLLAYYSGRSIYHPKIFKIVDTLQPDVLFIHGEDTLIGMQYIFRSSKLKFPLVTDCHMLEMASVNRFRKFFRSFYKTFITPIILKNNIPLIRVVDSDYVEKCLGIPLNKTILLSFGTDTDFFKPSSTNSEKFRRLHGISKNDFVIIYAGKLDMYKGGAFLAESIKEKIDTASDRKIVFIIIGNTMDEYGKKVEALFLESANKIMRFPTQAYFDLANFYQAADLAVFPKQCSLSFFEAQACGLPVLFEDNEINNSRRQFGNGFTFISGDTNDFRTNLLRYVQMNIDEFETMKKNSRNYIIENYNYVPIAQIFSDIMINEVINYRQKSKISSKINEG